MASTVAEIVAKLKADTTQFQAGLAEAQAETAKFNSGMSTMAKAGGLALGALGAAAVATGVVAVKAAMEQETATRLLKSAVESAGQSYGQYADKIGAAEKKAISLGFADEELDNGLAKLVRSTKDTGKSIELMGLAEDIARGRHISLSAATDILVKVEAGRVGLLGKLGLSTKDATGATISQEEALKRLTALYGGDAKAFTETFAGKIEVLKARLGELAEDIGFVLIPIIETLATGIADTVNWFKEHQAVAIALAAVIGGPLVVAMGAWVVEMYAALAAMIAIKAANFSATISNIIEWLVALGPELLLATAGLAAIGAAIVYFGSQDGVFERNAAAAKKWADTLFAAAHSSGHELKVLEDTHKELSSVIEAQRAKVADLEQNYAKYGLTIDEANNKARQLGYATDLNIQKDKLVRVEIEKLRQEHEKQLVVTEATAKAYGVTIPSSYDKSSTASAAFQKAVADVGSTLGSAALQSMLFAGGTTDAMEAVVKHVQSMDQATTQAIQGFTSLTGKFGDATSVGEQEVLDFVNGSRDQLAQWSSDLQSLAAAGVDQGIIEQLRTAGPKAEPLVQTLMQMVADGSIAVVNDTAAKITEITNTLNAALDGAAIATAIKVMEQTTVAKAAYADLREGGTSHLWALRNSSDENIKAAAYTFLVQINNMQNSVDGLHGKAISVTLDTSEAIANAYALQSVLDTLLATHPNVPGLGLLAGVNREATTGAHGLVAMAGGGVAGHIVNGPTMALIGEAGREAVLPLTRFSDMVATIKNTGMANQVAAAAIAAGGGGASSGGGFAGGSSTTIVNINVEGSVRTEAELVDAIITGINTKARGGPVFVGNVTR